ncbi:MAG: hypothetical protein Q9195_002553 [Heterodermia aff. obscurata]
MCLLFAVYVGIQVIAVSSSFIIGGSTSTFEGGVCTYYVPGRWSNNGEILGFSAHHGHQSFITETALFYADACYNPFQVPLSTATTLFLVGTGNIQYYAKSDDPIFPAQHMIHGSWPRENRWSHVGIARTVLGCVDEKIVWDTGRKQEWYLLNGQLHDASTQTWNITPPAIVNINDAPYSDKDFTALQLLCLALRSSDTASAVMFARNKWLDAASRVVELPERRFSLPLDKNQWQLEAQKLFNVSLARMQIEIIGMTQDVEYPNYTDSEAMLENYFHIRSMNPCGLIKLDAEGWQNISVVGFVGMIGLAVGLWTVTMEVGSTIVLVWLYKSVVKPALVSMLVGMQNAYRLTARGFH